MTKGYWIANNLVHDSEAYKAYQKANAGPLKSMVAGFWSVQGGRLRRKARCIRAVSS